MLSLKMNSHLCTVGLLCAGPLMGSHACWLATAFKHNACFASAALAVHCIYLPAQRCGVVKPYWQLHVFDTAVCNLVVCKSYLTCLLSFAELDQPLSSDETRKLAWSRIYKFFDKHLK